MKWPFGGGSPSEDESKLPVETPLKELFDLAKNDPTLLRHLRAWETKWVVQYAVEDDVSKILTKTEDLDEVTDILLKREDVALKFLGTKVADDCCMSDVIKSEKTKTSRHRYSVLAIRKRPI